MQDYSRKLFEIFLTLSKIDSPSHHENAMTGYLVDYFTQKKIWVKQDTSGNVFVKIDGTGKPLFLSAHMDTVEPGRNIQAKLAMGKIVSDGKTVLGADNKSTMAILLHVINTLPNPTRHRPLEVLFTVAEETTGSGAKSFDYSQLKAKEGLIADLSAPVGDIVLASPAYERFSISLQGTASHAAKPERARSVLPMLSAFLAEIPTGKLDPETVMNIGLIHAGTARNTVPGTAILEGEIRGFDENKIAYYKKILTRLCDTASKNNNLIIHFECQKDNGGYIFTESNSLIQKVTQVFQSLKIKPEYVKKWSCSDANVFNEKKLLVINIGDGTVDAHTVNESIALADMVTLTEIFKKMTESVH